MNRQQRRASLANGHKLQRQPWNKFEDTTIAARTAHEALSTRPRTSRFPDQVFQNNRYVVQVYHEVKGNWGPCDRAMIRRSDAEPIHSWSDLQRIKNEIWGDDWIALEVYPPAAALVDVANLYWLWVFPPEFYCPIVANGPSGIDMAGRE